jgi:hypothetical protein
MPSGFSSKSMYGAEISSLSRTIAKCCETFAGSWVGSALSDPRCAISRVISWNALRPLSVNSNVTLICPDYWSVACFGFLISVPDSAGLSWITHQRSGSGAVALGF